MRIFHIFKIVTLLICLPAIALAQGIKVDSIIRFIGQEMQDSVRNTAYWELHEYYEESNRDSSQYYIEEGINLTRKHGKKLAEARWLVSLAYLQLTRGRYAESLGSLLQAFSIGEKQHKDQNDWLSEWSGSPHNSQPLVLAFAHHTYANLMTPTLNSGQQIIHYREALELAKQVGNAERILLSNLGLGRTYLDKGLIDSALIFEKEAARIAHGSGLEKYLPAIQSYLGAIYFGKNEPDTALQHLYYGVSSAFEYGSPTGRLAQNYYRLTKYYLEQRLKDSALYYALKFEQAMEKVGAVSLSTVDKGTAYEYLFLAYQLNGQYDSAFQYQGIALTTKDSIFNDRKKSLAEFQNLNLAEQLRLRNLEKEQELYLSKIRSYGLLAGLTVFLVIAFILYRNNKQKQRTNKELESTLSNLRSTQTQLIQSEKMASLGELTAGIAHEIQNPLNFVNNFSEVSNELIDELNEELDKGEIQEAKAIGNDIKQNLEKINHHGKRADAIVKGMLAHSRTGSGKKEPTDINALCDEYLRLAYHARLNDRVGQGLKAKDPSFNASFHFEPDNTLPKVNVVPQDIGRVLLNLINNAFQACGNADFRMMIADFNPVVTVSTKKLGDNIEIRVKDNGPGIPENIKGKIFQPFFTTKPTGQGTGLGLSMSYDIVKAHGGELKVETMQGEGSEFIVELPLNK